MEPKLIHADGNLVEQAEIIEFDSFRADLTLYPDETSCWELALPSAAWKKHPVLTGDHLYIDGSEWGGPVEQVRHVSSEGTVRVSGPCWRQLLDRRIVIPESGETHVVISGAEAHSVISSLMDSWNNELFAVSAFSSGIGCSASIRYEPLLRALNEMLMDSRARLSAVFSGGTVFLQALRTRDLTDTIELSEEYDARLISTVSAQAYNHIIALGSGQMLERQTAQFWLMPDGTVTDSPAASSILAPLSTLLYDYPAVESEEELKNAARRRLLSCAAADGMEIETTSSEELELTDIVSVRDGVTGLHTTMSVLAVGLTVDSGGVRFTHRLGSADSVRS